MPRLAPVTSAVRTMCRFPSAGLGPDHPVLADRKSMHVAGLTELVEILADPRPLRRVQRGREGLLVVEPELIRGIQRCLADCVRAVADVALQVPAQAGQLLD